MSVALAGPSRLRSAGCIPRTIGSCACEIRRGRGWTQRRRFEQQQQRQRQQHQQQRQRSLSTSRYAAATLPSGDVGVGVGVGGGGGGAGGGGGGGVGGGTPPLKLAIIGAGPSGFYAASRILSLLPPESERGRSVQVHMYERLPTPYGLVRYGVAPDHPEVKNCQHKFDELCDDPRFTYLGNTAIGSQASSDPSQISPATTLSGYTYPHALHVPLSDLLPHYTSVLLTYGASLSQPLAGVAGASSSAAPLGGVYPALAFVSWYNGHPAFADLRPDLSGVEDVTIVGHGNVALDVARILLKPVDALRASDMPSSVLDVLARSAVKRVTAVGRRGPAQVAFTTKEFREMLHLPGVAFAGIDQALAEQAAGMVKGDRMRTRLLGLMSGTSTGSTTTTTGTGAGDAGGAGGDGKEFRLEFLQSPQAFLDDQGSGGGRGRGRGRVSAVEWTKNELLSPAPDAQGTPTPPASQVDIVPRAQVVARPTGATARSKADLVIESVGYRSEPLGVGEAWSLPFDQTRGRISNSGGRVVGEDGTAIPGMYAAGWVARGPVGVIASTMHDAYSLAALVLEDHFGPSDSGPSGTAPTPTSAPAPTLGTATSSGSSSSSSSGSGSGSGSGFGSRVSDSTGAAAGPIGRNRDPEPGLPDAVCRGLKEGTVVDLAGWRRIDRAERERATGCKEREKFTTVQDMLAVLS